MFGHWKHAANAAAAGLASLLMLLLDSCSSTSVSPEGVPSHLPDIQLSGSNDTPPHSMASYEYPFDSNGRYVTAWAAEGERRAGRSASATSDDTTKWGKSHGGSETSKKVASSGKSKSDSAKSKSSTSGKSKSASGSADKIVAKSDDDAGSAKGTASKKSKPKPSSSDTETSKVTTSTKAKAKPSSSDAESEKVTTTTKAKTRPTSSDTESNKATTSTKAKPKPSSSEAESSKVTTTTKAKPRPSSEESGGGSSSKSEAKPKAENGSSYTVKAGDTVERIARRCGTTTKKLMAANGMTSDFLKIGRVLKLP